MNLIVNADDLGLSHEINRGIVESYVNGIVTSTSLSACGSAFDEGVQILRSNPGLDPGIHLTLVGERPVASPSQVSSIVQENGSFFGDAKIFFLRYLMGRIRLHDIEMELEAQFQKIMDQAIGLTHIDSHQHIHLIPGIWSTVCDLAKRYGIRHIRYPVESPNTLRITRRRLAGRIVLASLGLLNRANSTTKFVGFTFGGQLSEENVRSMLSVLSSKGTYELMCHPGFSGSFSSWGYSHDDERLSLQSRDLSHFLERANVNLIGFRDLAD